MEYVKMTENLALNIEYTKMYLFGIGTYFMVLKILNKKTKGIVAYIFNIVILANISKFLEEYIGIFYSIIFFIFGMSIICYKLANKDIINSIMVITIASCLNYLIYVLGIIIGFIIEIILKVRNDYIMFGIICVFYIIISIYFIK